MPPVGSSSHPSGRYGNGNGNGGFRDGRGGGQPSRPPPAAQPRQQLTPQEKEATLLAAGRLAAEYLVARGDLAPHVLENRPPALIPSRQHHQQQPAPHRTSPSPFQGGHGPFPKRPRQGAQQRPFPYAARGPAPPKPGYAAAAPVTASKAEEDNVRSASAGDTSESVPTAQPSGVTPGPQQTNQPSSSSVGANDSK